MKTFKVKILRNNIFFGDKESARKYFERAVDNGCEVDNFEFAIDDRNIRALEWSEREEEGVTKTMFLLEPAK